MVNNMSENYRKFIKSLTLGHGIPINSVKSIERELGISFPEGYVDFVTFSNGATGSIGEYEYIDIWAVEELMTRNRGYGVEEFSPGLLLFGSNGGGLGYAFDFREKKVSFIEIHFMDLGTNDYCFCGHTFLDFLDHIYNKK